MSEGSLVVIDYLQMLDEKRINPPLQEQVDRLREFAKQTSCIIVFISQLARKIEYRDDKEPTMSDIRLPNPLDLSQFNKVMLLSRKSSGSTQVEVMFYQPKEFRLTINWDIRRAFFN